MCLETRGAPGSGTYGDGSHMPVRALSGDFDGERAPAWLDAARDATGGASELRQQLALAAICPNYADELHWHIWSSDRRRSATRSAPRLLEKTDEQAGRGGGNVPVHSTAS